MSGAVLTEPVSPGSHAGILFMDGDGYSAMSGHGIIATTTIAFERGLIDPGVDEGTIVFDTPAGDVRARALRAPPVSGESDGQAGERGAGGTGEAGKANGTGRASQRRVESVAFLNVPSFVVRAGISVRLATRTVRADLAYGGRFYAIVDAEASGVGLDAPHVPELRRVGMALARAIESMHQISNPFDRRQRGVDGVVFTGPSSDGRADLRNATVFANGQLARSPSGTGTAAVMAVLDAMGLVDEARPFVHESLIGTRFTGRIAGRTVVDEYPAIVPEIEGSSWITGEHTFLVDGSDPFPDGFRI